jgi:hypothetical protein
MILCLIRWKDQPDEGPRLCLPRTQRQDSAITALHSFVYATQPLNDDNTFYDQSLDKVLHEILEAIYYQELHHENYIACIVDVVLILLSLNDDGTIRKGSQITHFCAVQYYLARSTCTHSLRLHSIRETHYVPLSSSEPTRNDGIIDGDDDGSFVK